MKARTWYAPERWTGKRIPLVVGHVAAEVGLLTSLGRRLHCTPRSATSPLQRRRALRRRALRRRVLRRRVLRRRCCDGGAATAVLRRRCCDVGCPVACTLLRGSVTFGRRSAQSLTVTWLERARVDPGPNYTRLRALVRAEGEPRLIGTYRPIEVFAFNFKAGARRARLALPRVSDQLFRACPSTGRGRTARHQRRVTSWSCWPKTKTVHPKHSVIAGPGCSRTSSLRIWSVALDAAVPCDGPRFRRPREHGTPTALPARGTRFAGRPFCPLRASDSPGDGRAVPGR